MKHADHAPRWGLGIVSRMNSNLRSVSHTRQQVPTARTICFGAGEQTPSFRMRDRRASGFTLIEILVVVVIIGILGAVIVPNLLSRPDQARATAAQTDLRQLASALDIYRLDNFHYPSTEQGLEALVSRPAGFPEPKNWNPDGYVKMLPEDPWGSPYVYEQQGSDFTLFSLGADGNEGGEGLNADITFDGF